MLKGPRADGRRGATKRAGPRRTETAPESRSGLLAGVVGHELNNISVPLQGFADLAEETGELSRPLRECLAEISIAVDRIRWLASELESLGESDSRPARTSLGACLPPADSLAPGNCRIHWNCAESTSILVDRRHAQRAIESLVQAAARGSSRPSGVTLRVSAGVPSRAHCAACGVTLGAPSKFVRVQTEGARAVPLEALRDPFGSALTLKGTRRLALAVLVHCAHRAGGHVLIEDASGSLGVAFPLG